MRMAGLFGILRATTITGPSWPHSDPKHNQGQSILSTALALPGFIACGWAILELPSDWLDVPPGTDLLTVEVQRHREKRKA
jgi:uncharacterized protein (DUF1501 family)